MKNIFHFPPHLKPLDTLSPPAYPDLIPLDALEVANDLFLSINETLTEYCRIHRSVPCLNKLSHAANGANTASTLIQHALTRM